MTGTSEIVASVQAILDEVDGFPYVESRLRALVTEANKGDLEPFIIALGYHFIGHDEEEARARSEDAFGAAIEFDNRRFPPLLKSLPSTILERWDAAVTESEHPALLARLNDLLWVTRHGERPDLHARAASDAYRSVAEGSNWHPLERADCLARALELARAVSDQERLAAAEASGLRLLSKSIASEPDSDVGSPGVVLTLLRALNDLGNLDAKELDEWLVKTDARFPTDPHLRDSVTDLREPISDPETRKALRKEQVGRWRRVAENATGLLRAVHLEHALELARLHRLSDEEKELLVELQEISPDELELKEISAEVEIPTEKIREFVESFLDSENRWQMSLIRFGNFGPPGGTDKAVEEQVASQMKKAPIQFLVNKVVYGPAGTSIFKAVDDTSHKHLAAAEHRAFAARIWSLTAVQVLEEIRNRSGKPQESEVAEFFTTELIPAELASRLARSLDLYWDGHYDEAAHMLAPRIEWIIRELARRVGIPIIAPPLDLRAGRVRSLGDLLHALKGAFGEEEWRAYLKNVLTDPLGVNLRNVVGHALHPVIGQTEAALLIHAACYLRLLGAKPSDSSKG